MPIQSMSMLAKKTKNEIIEEYQKLLSRLEDAKILSQTSLADENSRLIAAAKSFQLETILKEAENLKEKTRENFNGFTINLNELIKTIVEQISGEMKKFEEIQKAIEASKMVLKNQYHLEVSAETLNLLISQYETKKKELAAEAENLEQALKKETEQKKKLWEREQEEYEYQQNQAKLRDEEAYQVETAKRKTAWLEREEVIKKQEEENTRLRAEAQKYPEMLKQELRLKEKEVAEKLSAEHKNVLAAEKRDHEAAVQLLKLKNETYESQIKRLEFEAVTLRKEQEAANRKAQDLAIKLIESGAANRQRTENQPAA